MDIAAIGKCREYRALCTCYMSVSVGQYARSVLLVESLSSSFSSVHIKASISTTRQTMMMLSTRVSMPTEVCYLTLTLFPAISVLFHEQVSMLLVTGLESSTKGS